MKKLFLVTGSTWILRKDLKAIGGRWNPLTQVWLVPCGSRDQLEALSKIASLDVVLFDPQTGHSMPMFQSWRRHSGWQQPATVR